MGDFIQLPWYFGYPPPSSTTHERCNTYQASFNDITTSVKVCEGIVLALVPLTQLLPSDPLVPCATNLGCLGILGTRSESHRADSKQIASLHGKAIPALPFTLDVKLHL